MLPCFTRQSMILFFYQSHPEPPLKPFHHVYLCLYAGVIQKITYTSHDAMEPKVKAVGFARAGPRQTLHFDPEKGIRAAIVTCGGLCPGKKRIASQHRERERARDREKREKRGSTHGCIAYHTDALQFSLQLPFPPSSRLLRYTFSREALFPSKR